mgnify:CR=1 FL=1
MYRIVGTKGKFRVVDAKGVPLTRWMSRAKAQEHLQLVGEGFFSDFKDKVVGIAKKIIPQKVQEYFKPDLTNYPRSAGSVLSTYGMQRVTQVVVFRQPIQKALGLVINAITAGKMDELMKKYGFEKFYHLGACLKLLSGKSVIVEKNERVAIRLGDVPSNAETYSVTPGDVSLYQLVENARKLMGDERFFGYTAIALPGRPQNNCQNFQIGLLEGSGLLTNDAKAFILQDIEQLAKELPEVSKQVVSGITDAAATVGKIIGTGRQGGSTTARSMYYVDPRETINNLAHAVNQVTSPEEVRDVLMALERPPPAPPRRHATDPRVRAKYSGPTLHQYYVDYRESAFKTADRLRRVLDLEHEACLEMLDAVREGDSGKLMSAVQVVAGGITAFETVKDMASSPAAIMKFGTDALQHVIDVIAGNKTFDPKATTSYSYADEFREMTAFMMGPTGELVGSIAGPLLELFGAETTAKKNDKAVESKINGKYQLSLQYIDNFKRDWDKRIADTAKQEADIAAGVEKKREGDRLYLRYTEEVPWMQQRTDEQWRAEFGGPRPSPYISFEDWKLQNLVGEALRKYAPKVKARRH